MNAVICYTESILTIVPQRPGKIIEIATGEIWKDIPGFEGVYQVSSMAQIRALQRTIKTHGNGTMVIGERLKHQHLGCGYPSVNLTINGRSKTYRVHRLFALVFIPNPENKPFINHINGIKTDNRIENLEWVTAAENIQHAKDTGLMPTVFKRCTGMNHFRSKPVVQFDMAGNYISEYENSAFAQTATGVDNKYIQTACRGRQKSAGGYKWSYKKVIK